MDHDQLAPSRFLRGLTLAALPALLAAGCGAEPSGDSATSVEVEQGAIIGGWTISDATRRSLGLLTMGGGCSASLVAPDWVVTATHCINFGVAASNTFSVPTQYGWVESRSASMLYPMANTDVTLVKLTGTASVNWPNVTHPLYTSDPSTLVGQDVICYGQGSSAYASPSGVTGGGTWKMVTKRVDHVGADNTLVLLADAAGSEILAPGDSGGPCFYNNALVSETWRVDTVNCANGSTNATCAATITRINGDQVRTVAEFAPQITAAMNGRPAASWVPLALQGTWQNRPLDYAHVYTAASTLVGTNVHLRGEVLGGGSSSYLLTLPAGQRPSATVYTSVSLGGSAKGRLMIQTNGNVYVYSASGDWHDADLAVWLDGVWFALSTSVYTAIPLQNSWTTTVYGTRGIAAQDDGGIVRLQGAISTTSTNTNLQPFVLPPSFRPTTDVYVTIDLFNGAKGRAYIQSSGAVTIVPTVAGSAQGFTSFEGVSFSKGSGTTLAPYSGWTNGAYGTSALKIRNANGIVILSGAVGYGTSPYIAYLPEQYRPAGYVSAVADLCNGAYGRIFVRPDGWVYVSDAQGFGSNLAGCFTSLEGVQFGL